MKTHAGSLDSPAPAIPQSHRPTPSRRRRRHRALRAIAIVFGSLIGLVCLLLGGLSLYLTPERLTGLINREASRYLKADVRAHNVSYTLWSSFPRLKITTDSITVRSRTLDTIPDAIRRKLPADADFLGALSDFSGSINVVDLFLNRYVIHDVRVDGLRLNFVAYNDSINNYDIFPSTATTMKGAPYVSAHLVSLHDPGAISYYSYASDTRATLRLSDLELLQDRDPQQKNCYRLALGGKVTARSAGIDILHDFPFSLSGDLQMRFDPYGVRLTDYAIDLGEIHSRLSMSVGMGDDPRIESFDYRIASVNLMDLLGYVPREYLPALQGISADLPISASARLLSSWSLSSEVFPSIEVDFSIPRGEVGYTVSFPMSADGKGGRLVSYRLEHSPMEGRFIFDGDDPSKSHITIPPFDVSAPGIKATVSGEVTDLTTRPLITALLGIDADVSEALRYFPSATGVRGSGHFTSSTGISCRIPEFSRDALTRGLLDLRTSGGFAIRDFRLCYPADSLEIHVDNLTASIGASADGIAPGSLDSPVSRVVLTADNTLVSTPSVTLRGNGLSILTRTSSGAELTPASLRQGVPLRLDIKAAGLECTVPGDSVRVTATGLYVNDMVAPAATESYRKALSDGLTAGAKDIGIAAAGYDLGISGAAFDFSVAERSAGAIASLTDGSAAAASRAADSPTATDSESCTAESPAHTAELIEFPVPDRLKDILERFTFAANLKFDRCSLSGPGFGEGDYISGVDLSLDPEQMLLRGMQVDLSGTMMRLNGRAGNLRRFLTEPASAANPLDLDFDVAIPCLDLNAITAGYVESQGGEEAVRRQPTTYPSDTVAMLIPRNLKAAITARIGESQYTNLDLSDIVAEISVADGRADISRLGVGASFGRAEASFAYDTSDLHHMSLSGKVDILKVDIVRFFDKFPTVLGMMPQMSNLSGMISVKTTLKSDIFPTMYLDVPSARASFAVEGRDLKVHQNKFIRRITRMMLIRTDDDIHIDDIDARGAIHDNLLQIYPFDIIFDRYNLRMLGVNNFKGELYYHIAVEKSPVPFPFAINIEGTYGDPKLRFGGAAFDIKRGERITSQMQTTKTVNITHMMRILMQAFVCTGARYHTSTDK